jgi:hypothetical protein
MNPTEGLLYSTKAEIKARVLELKREISFLEQIYTGCGACQHYVAGRVCALAGNIEPPAEVKDVGCPAWKWDGVPF